MARAATIKKQEVKPEPSLMNAKDDTDAKGNMGIKTQEDLFREVMEGSDRVTKITLSNGFVVSMRTPSAFEVSIFQTAGTDALYHNAPEVYAQLVKYQTDLRDANGDVTKVTPFSHPQINFAVNYGILQGVCGTITPTFENMDTVVNEDDIWKFVNALPETDINLLMETYMRLAGMGGDIQVSDVMDSFREDQ